MSQSSTDEAVAGVSRTRVIVVLGVGVAAVVGYFVLGMPGMDHGGGGMVGMAARDASDVAIGVDAFAARVTDSDAFVVNVHVPDEGAIVGTDAAIPYEGILDDLRLPERKSTPLALYCKTGRMSADAATTLMDAGYTDVVYLDGGMDGWTAAGRSLE